MIHNQLTSYAQLLAGYRRMLGEMGADFSGIERAGETLTPIMDPWALPEWALLRGEVLYARRTGGGAAGAGNFTSLEFVNPAGSGVLATILEIQVTPSFNAVEYSVDVGPALGVVLTARGVIHDTRGPAFGEVSRCTMVVGVLLAGVALSQGVINVAERMTRPLIIRPGAKLFLIPGAANTSNDCSIFWSERPLLPAEQSGTP